MRRANEIIDGIIESSKDNTAGLVMSKHNIREMVYKLRYSRCLNSSINQDSVNDMMSDYESDEGFLVKAQDFIYEINK